MASTADEVRIQYRRLPDRDTVFVQRLVHRDAGCIVTFMPATPMERPLEVAGEIVLEDGSPAIWFTFPGEWHDVGRFHRADGTFTGIYANVLTPVALLDDTTWETTDLFLDLWLPRDGEPGILDEDELLAAEIAGAIEPRLAERARQEARRLRQLALSGDWPPAIVGDWSLERVLTRTGGRD